MTEETDKYNTIKKISEGTFKEKGSKFFAFAYPITTEYEIKTVQKEKTFNLF